MKKTIKLTHLDDVQCLYTPDAGTHPQDEVIHCGVCGEAMNSQFGQLGPRGFAMALGGSVSSFDKYACPHMKADWHIQVVKLRQAAKESPSKIFEDMLLNEAKEILQTRKATK